MSKLTQSLKEIERLTRIHDELPQVKRFRQAVEDFARENNLSFDVEGMRAVSLFSAAWLKEHGSLPDSGIKAG